jgi:hypothetical protein
LITFLIKIILSPFTLIGAIWSIIETAFFSVIFAVLRGLRYLLLSPWGLILPVTGILVLVLAAFIEQQPRQLGLQLVKAAAVAEPSEVQDYFDQIRKLGNDAIPGIVYGLTIPSERLFFFCRDTIDERLQWTFNADIADAEATYLLLINEFENNVDDMNEPSKMAILGWTQQILWAMVERSNGANAHGTNEQFTQRNRITARCEQLLGLLPAITFKPSTPYSRDNASQFARGGEPRAFGENLTAWVSPNQRYERDNSVPMFDRFSHPRAEELQAFYLGNGNVDVNTLPPQRKLQNVDSDNKTLTPEMLAAVMHPARSPQKAMSVGDVNKIDTIPTLTTAASEAKVASQVTESTEPVTRQTERKAESLTSMNISKSYIESHSIVTDDEPQQKNDTQTPSLLPPETPYKTNYTPVEHTQLGKLPLRDLPNCSTADLLRLLHHRDADYVEEAKQLLTTREKIPLSHVQSLTQLYHPKAEVRLDFARRLPNLRTPRLSEWAAIIIQDPNPNIRYATIASLATTGDPEIQRLLSEQSQKEPNPRNTALLQQIRDFQSATRATTGGR